MKKKAISILTAIVLISVVVSSILSGCGDGNITSSAAPSDMGPSSGSGSQAAESGGASSGGSDTSGSSSEKTSSSDPQPSSTTAQPSKTSSATGTKDTSKPSGGSFSMDDALFIGDSRTLGFFEYTDLSADCFAKVGMSVYNIYDDRVSVPGVGKVKLSELLSNKKYGKIYIMLGFNEIGYPFDGLVAKYSELVGFVRKHQPGAKIILEANLHVTKKRSDTHEYEKNPVINRLNKAIEAMADGKTVYYIDINELFDDASGNLAADKTSDGVHPYAKYYAAWTEWIIEKSRGLLGGN